MKVLSLWEPWATLIAEGIKKVETRGWDCSFRGTLLIHAAATKSPEGRLLWLMLQQHRLLPAHLMELKFEQLPFRHILCRTEVVEMLPTLHARLRKEYTRFTDAQDHVQSAFDEAKADDMEYLLGDYSRGRFGWMLRDTRKLVKPILATGRQGLWEWTAPTQATREDQQQELNLLN